MSKMEKVREGLKERGRAFGGLITGSDMHTWFSCAGRETSLIQRDDGTIDLICYDMDAEQVLAFVDVMESK